MVRREFRLPDRVPGCRVPVWCGGNFGCPTGCPGAGVPGCPTIEVIGSEVGRVDQPSDSVCVEVDRVGQPSPF